MKKPGEMSNKEIQMLLLLVVAAAAAISGATASSIPEDVAHNPLEHDSLHKKHFDGGEHNAQFDHEAFLGPDESKKFDGLTPEESRRRLGLIVDRIDENKDGLVNLSELKNWIAYTQRRYIEEDVSRVWKQHNPENNNTISWDTYRNTVYGFMDDLDTEEQEQEEGGGYWGIVSGEMGF